MAPRRLDAADAAHLEEHGFCVVRGLVDKGPFDAGGRAAMYAAQDAAPFEVAPPADGGVSSGGPEKGLVLPAGLVLSAGRGFSAGAPPRR